MKFVNQDESWSSRTEISRYVSQIYPGALLSWRFTILVTTRELPFKNDWCRSLAKLEARDEAKKQKSQKNKKEDWDTAGWNQSSWTWTASSSSSTWHEWSPDEARARSDWQSVDWDSSKSNAHRYYTAVAFYLAMRSSTQILSTRASMATRITSVCN